MKVIYVGKEGSGKTLLMGRETERLVYKNIARFKKTGVMRDIVSNIEYSEDFIEWAEQKGVKIKRWQHIQELEKMTEVDLFMDEVGAYFDSRNFADLPLSTRLWLAQAQKLGVHIYGGAQDWAQIDVSFRRLVNRLYEVKKIVGSQRPSKTLPGSKYPWAFALQYQLDPTPQADTAEARKLTFIPSLLYFSKKDTERFDTNARVALSDPPPLRKIVRVCPEDGHKKVRYV